MRADRGVGGGSHRASRLDKKSTWRPGLLACPELSRLVACGFTRGHKSHRGNIGIPFLRVERRHRGGSSTIHMPTCLYSAYLKPSTTLSSTNSLQSHNRKEDNFFCQQGFLCNSPMSWTGIKNKTIKALFFQLFFNDEARALQKVCVWGLIRVCWPRLIRGIGCISADQGAPSAWQCELSGLFPPISPHFQLPPFHRPKYTTPSNTFSCYFMATLHNSGFNPTYEAKSPVSMTE